ncbi:SCP-like protein [Oesophagostomum dentatum]|uniref:SCP-like protein n=1 Tax=Oesophagostomum dentatum TaxID=61180 RepID=A0A0B1STJ9_OESDE|nr:SCP-like protein [Oesophagostomum dentatum]
MSSAALFKKLIHIIFLFQVAGSAATRHSPCDVENPTSNVRKSLMLYDHNLYRSRIAQGIAIHSGGNKLPRGSNIYKVEWSCHLEKLASEAVKDCLTQKPDSGFYGQNYEFIETADEYDLSNPYPLALERWIAPMLDKNFGNDVVTFTGDSDVQAFANMIRANTTHIGCSQKTCRTFAAISCFYDSPDITDGEIIYKNGEGCKHDSDCTTFLNSTCDAGKWPLR